MILDSSEESMCDDADAPAASDKKVTVDEHYTCFAEYKTDIYKYLQEKEVLCNSVTAGKIIN